MPILKQFNFRYFRNEYICKVKQLIGSCCNMNNRTKFTAMLFALSILSFTFCSLENVLAQTSTNSDTLESASEHLLTLFDNSHYNRPIYANYTILNLTLLFQSPEINSSSHVYVHYSHNMVNWTSLELPKTDHLTRYSAFYVITLGPFLYDCEYFIKFNATQGSTELASGYLRILVEKVEGIIFVDFSYRVKTQSDNSQLADISIIVLGADIKLGSVYVASDQQLEGEGPVKMNLDPDTNHTYKATIGPINSWNDFIKLSFNASTSDDTLFTNTNYFIYKEKTNQPEGFWTSKFPAILIGVIVMGAMTTIFVMAKRRPPRRV